MSDQPLVLPDIPPLRDARARSAVVELSAMVRSRIPAATFEIVEGEEPGTTRMWTTVELVIDRTMDLLIDDGIPIYVLPLRAAAREAEVVAANRARRPMFASGD